MKNLQKALISILLLSLSTFSLAQSDSTNLPGLSATRMTTPTTTSGTGVPNAGATDTSSSNTTTEMMVQACPTTGGNGYGYYPNGPVPADGSISDATNITGGVIYERSVTTDRYGTITYGGWYQLESLCTAIPYPPACPSGQTQTTAPYWDWGSNQWVGLTCANPVTTATQQSACGSANFGYNGQMTAANSMGTYNGIVSDMSTYAEYAYCWGGTVTSTGSSPGYSNTIYDTYSYELGVGTDPYGYGQRTATGGGMCWLQAGTNNVVAKTVFGIQKNPGTCH